MTKFFLDSPEESSNFVDFSEDGFFSVGVLRTLRGVHPERSRRAEFTLSPSTTLRVNFAEGFRMTAIEKKAS